MTEFYQEPDAHSIETWDEQNDATEGYALEENLILTREEVLDIADKVFAFCEASTGVKLFPFQAQFGLRVIQSILLNDGDEITALFSRQAGKTETVANIVCGCEVILPILATIDGIKEDSRISQFKDGLWVGIFAPTYEQSGIMHRRMAMRMSSEQMRDTLRDPEIDMEPGFGSKILRLRNGSFVDCNSAGPQTNIEGKTYHLVLCEETQDISNYKLKKSIHPMLAATNGTIVKIGTPNPHRNDFYDACARGRKHDLEKETHQLQRHFRFDYHAAAKANPKYNRYVKKEIERLGYDSDEFRMAYRLHWLIERSQFIAPEQLDSLGIVNRDKLKAKVYDGANIVRTTFVRPDYPATHDRTTRDQVASIDFGRSKDSTVVTIGRVWWDNPIAYSGDQRYYLHVVNWLEIHGDDHEVQYPQILDFLGNYSVSQVIVDSTGRGEPIYDRMRYDLQYGAPEHGIEGEVRVRPFNFSRVSKHRGYKLLKQEVTKERITYPAGAGAQRMRKWKRFVQQTTELVKIWKGKHMVVEAPSNHKGNRLKFGNSTAKDDYPDSWMMLCWLVNGTGEYRVESADNPFYDRSATEDAKRYGRERLVNNTQSRRPSFKNRVK